MPLAPRLQNLGVHTFPVSTKVARAQLFMNQGLNLTYGFNHAEAARAFAEAARLDPNAGDGLLGPGAGARPEHQRADGAGGRAEGARAVAEGGRAQGQGHRRASAPTSTRWRRATPASAEDRAARRSRVRRRDAEADGRRFRTTSTRARSMRKSLMDLRPWSYWTRDGLPYDETTQVQAALEHVIGEAPEPSRARCTCGFTCGNPWMPKRAEAEADRLRAADAGRRPHGPHAGAHLSARRPSRRRDPRQPAGGEGRRGLHRAVPRAGAVSARRTTRTTCTSSGWARRRAGRGRSRSNRRESSPARCRPKALQAAPILQGFLVVPYWAMVRFGEWDQILADKGRAHDTAFTQRVWTLRARDGARREGSARRGRARAGRAEDARRRSGAEGPDDVLGQQRRRRSCGSRPKWSRARSRPSARTGTAPCCTSSARSATRMRWSTRSRPTGTCRRGRTSRRC